MIAMSIKRGPPPQPAGRPLEPTLPPEGRGEHVSLRLSTGQFEFVIVPVLFEPGNTSNVFRFKNNKTVGETVEHPRYQHLREKVLHDVRPLNRPLGEFLYDLKLRGDRFYKAFLNAYGDEVYCSFSITDPSIVQKRGVYLYTIEDRVRYVGRCLDNFGKRINQGYGRIHPKNCYLDGQSTNCRLNSLIAKHRDVVSFYVSILDDVSEIPRLETEILESLAPDWNIQGV
jgi:hypothetical protein